MFSDPKNQTDINNDQKRRMEMNSIILALNPAVSTQNSTLRSGNRSTSIKCIKKSSLPRTNHRSTYYKLNKDKNAILK